MVDVTANYYDLIGKKFAYGGRGPDEYDCFGLLMEMHRRCGQEITDYGSPTEGPAIISIMLDKVQQWRKTESHPGASMLIRLPHTMHVGFVLPYNKFIHTWERSGGVTVEYMRDWKHRILGYYDYVQE